MQKYVLLINQRKETICPGIGEVQLIVGVRKRDKTKIQYCITALTPIIRIKEKSSHK